MSGSTRLRKDASNNADTKLLSHEEVYSLLNSLQSEVSSLKSARNSDAAEMQSLRLALSPPPPALSPYPQNQRAVSSVVLCIVFDSELLVDNNPLLLESCYPQENRAILHFIDATILPNFALCIGVIPARTSSKDFFNAIKARCCPGNRFQKLKVVRDLLGVLIENGAGQPQSNTTIISTLRRAFAIFKKLGVDTDELEGLLAQAGCHAPPKIGQVAFNQLVTVAILAKGNEKPSLTFLGQVIMNADSGQCPSPFVYRVSDPLAPAIQLPRPHSPFFPNLLINQAMCAVPLSLLSTGWGGGAFTVDIRDTGELTAHIPRGFPTQIHGCLLLGLPVRCTREHLSDNHRPNQPLTTNESEYPSMQDIPPFRIFFADSNSSVTISQTTTLKLPVKNGFVIICDVPFSQKILGRLCRVGVMALFNGLSLSLLVTTTFANDCWWLDIVHQKETSWSAAASSSHCLLEMNPISLPTSVSLSARGWHKRLGHACDKFVISFLKQHVPSFELKSWKSFYCEFCSKAKSTHCLAKACIDIPKQKTLDLLVSDIIGPFADNTQGLWYLLTIPDHVLTYSIVYPLKSRYEAPEAILDAVRQLQVRLGTTPKALRTDNARGFTSANFTNALASLGITFCPSLPYSPQENGKAEQLNQTLGDMA
ncbi:hypothetical protein O181_063822 [Austropuccinia psidii MF-1]|uniref:Integrase catalytic domain-containing protein n=1 Tax=Austropuccinia psidii MF-1 TaxID=1389203 RepID=A0A9Q3EQC0_9BASI|nr:hypothetical protein [Austropuccinia psidii MF-1]